MEALAWTQQLILSDQEFLMFQQLIREKAGISMTPAKKELLQSRLKSRVHDLGFSSFGSYAKHLQKLALDNDEWQVFINSLTTNKTDFFREPQHFDFLLKHLLPEWQLRGQSPFKLWCAAASTGEEPYTLSMCLNKGLPPTKKYQIFATDIDTDVLRTAQRGVYRRELLSQVPLEYQKSTFAMGTGEIVDWMKVKDIIRNPIEFRRHNLLDKAPQKEYFDAVFCRNVLIYFSKETIEQVIHELYRSTKRGGYLFIGHSESLQNIRHEWRHVAPSVYRKDV